MRSMARRGIDVTRWDRSSIDLGALKAQGHSFVISYFSNDPSKDWTREWADQVAGAGMDCMAVLETDVTSGGLGGYASGVAHGQMCRARKPGMGMDLSCPMAVAFDYDVPQSQWGLLDDYLRGFAAADGVKPIPYTNGAYILHSFDAGLIFVSEGRGGWLSCSTGFSGFRAAHDSGRLLLWQENCGNNYDGDIAYASYFGQWQPGKTPTQENDLTPQESQMLAEVHDQLTRAWTSFVSPPEQARTLVDMARALRQDLAQPQPSRVPGSKVALNPLQAALNADAFGYEHGQALAVIGAQVAGLKAAVTALAAQSGAVTVDEMTKIVDDAVNKAVAEHVSIQGTVSVTGVPAGP